MRGRRGVFGQGGRKRRKTVKVRENEGELEERGQTTATAHPPSHTQTHALWSEVHLQFALTITTPRRKRAEGRARDVQERRSDVVSGGKEGGNKGEVGRESSN